MSNEEIGYIAVQKKPAVTIFPDSIVVTNKRIILCKPKTSVCQWSLSITIGMILQEPL